MRLKEKFNHNMEKCMDWLCTDSSDRRDVLFLGGYVAILVITVELALWVIQGVTWALHNV